MADEKKEPPKAAEGAETPAQKSAAEGGGASPQAKPDAGAILPSRPLPRVPVVVRLVHPAKPPAAAPPKPAGGAASQAGCRLPKAPVKPEPWTKSAAG